MTRDLVGCISGRDSGGARYRVDITRSDDLNPVYTVTSTYAGGTGNWRGARVLIRTATASTAWVAATMKFWEKMDPNAERCYSTPINIEDHPEATVITSGALRIPRIPRGYREAPDHPLVWYFGKDSAYLPRELRSRIWRGTASPPPSSESSRVTPTPTPGPLPTRASAPRTARLGGFLAGLDLDED